MPSIIVDTNVFGVLFDRKTPNQFSKLSHLLKAHVREPHEFRMTHYGFLEKVGLDLPKPNISLPKALPITPCDPRSIKAFGQDACNVLGFLRNKAQLHYKNHVTSETLKEREQNQRQNYWKDDAEALHWLEKLLPVNGQYEALAKDIVDLLSIDFQHGYSQLPKEMEGPIQAMMTLALGVEYSGESGTPRNIVLGRIFKKMWLSRVQSGDKLSKEVIEKFHEAMRFKNSADFVDLEIIYMSLVGHYSQGTYKPVHCITSDPPDKIKRRLFVTREIIDALNRDVFPLAIAGDQLSIRYTPGTILVVDKNLDVVEFINPRKIKAADLV